MGDLQRLSPCGRVEPEANAGRKIRYLNLKKSFFYLLFHQYTDDLWYNGINKMKKDKSQCKEFTHETQL